VRLELESADVIHSFWVPQLGGKRDLIPGHQNELTLTPLVAGYYYGECAEFCGLSHANMRFRVMVDPPERFDDWKYHEAAGATMPVHEAVTGDPVAAGAMIFSTSPCTTCHTIAGVSSGRLGPNLTHFGSRTTLAGGILENNPQNLADWLRNPQKLKPGAQMPALGLSQKQTSQLVAYLESLK
jgi:cytochrome c oxidase subunit 2